MKQLILAAWLLAAVFGPASVLPVLALDSSLDFSFSQSTSRSMEITPDGLQVLVSRSYQLSESVLVSQDLGDLWSLSGSFSSSQTFTTNLRLALVPQTLAFQGGVSFNPWDFLSIGLEYNNTSVNTFFLGLFYTEHEPILSVTFTPDFGVDWFSLSTAMTAAYYYLDVQLAVRQGWGFSLNLIPQFTVPGWNLDIGLPTALTFDLQGYRGATMAGFNSVAPNLSVTWTVWDTLSLNLTAGYNFSLSPDPGTRLENSYPFVQIGVGFLLMGTGDGMTVPDDEPLTEPETGADAEG